MLKNIAISAVLLLLNPSISKCQRNTWDVGFEVGPSAKSLFGNHDVRVNTEPRLSYSTGITCTYNFKNHLSFMTGARYENKGAKIYFDKYINDGVLVGKVNGEYSFDYLTLPILTKLKFGKKNALFICAGPYASFLLKAKEHYSKDNYTPEINNNIKDNYQTNEYGISAGMGVNYRLNKLWDVAFEVKDNVGITNISSRPVKDGTIQTNTLNFLISFTYKAGKNRT